MVRFPKPGPRKKKRKTALSKRAKRKIDDGRRDLENKCMDLWRQIVTHGKTGCEWCGKKKRVMQCHHIITKGSSKALKYDPYNGLYLCQGCHYRLHNAGYLDFSVWFDKKFPGRYDSLKLRKNNKIDHSEGGLQIIVIGLTASLMAKQGILTAKNGL